MSACRIRSVAISDTLASQLYRARNVEANDTAIWNAIEFDDVLAAGLARLLVWSDPRPLPSLGDDEAAWALYLRTWRPGAYARGTPDQQAALRTKWSVNYDAATREVGHAGIG